MIDAAVTRPVSWLSFTVPQDQRQRSYFTPLGKLRPDAADELYLARAPYHPKRQEPGTTAAQVRLIDDQLGGRSRGICTECGTGASASTTGSGSNIMTAPIPLLAMFTTICSTPSTGGC